jgi:hypothetical protein
MSYKHFFEHLKPDSQETDQNFEKRVLQKCLRITFYIYKPVNPLHFLKKHQNRCTLLYIQNLGKEPPSTKCLAENRTYTLRQAGRQTTYLCRTPIFFDIASTWNEEALKNIS